jgi:hypothetical protein
LPTTGGFQFSIQQSTYLKGQNRVHSGAAREFPSNKNTLAPWEQGVEHGRATLFFVVTDE